MSDHIKVKQNKEQNQSLLGTEYENRSEKHNSKPSIHDKFV